MTLNIPLPGLEQIICRSSHATPPHYHVEKQTDRLCLGYQTKLVVDGRETRGQSWSGWQKMFLKREFISKVSSFKPSLPAPPSILVKFCPRYIPLLLFSSNFVACPPIHLLISHAQHFYRSFLSLSIFNFCGSSAVGRR